MEDLYVRKPLDMISSEDIEEAVFEAALMVIRQPEFIEHSLVFYDMDGHLGHCLEENGCNPEYDLIYQLEYPFEDSLLSMSLIDQDADTQDHLPQVDISILKHLLFDTQSKLTGVVEDIMDSVEEFVDHSPAHFLGGYDDGYFDEE